MKIVKLSLVLALLASLTGCLAIALNGFYLPGDLVQDERMMGQWDQVKDQDKEGAEADDAAAKINLRFASNGKSGYDLALTEGEKTNSFTANLFLLNDQLYLDLNPQLDSLTEMNSYFSSHLVKAHSVARVQLSDDRLKLIFMDSDSLKKIILRRKIKMEYCIIIENDDQVFLTGQTEELQKLLKKYPAELFGGNALEFVKKE